MVQDTTQLVNIQNAMVWKTTKDLDIAEGTEITIKGTIKSHDEYKGVEQTKLVRCKII